MSQNTNKGFFGRKFIIDLQGLGSYPLWRNYNNPLLEASGNNLRQTSRKPIFGFSGHIAYSFTNKFMLGFEFSQQTERMPGPSEYYSSEDYYDMGYSTSSNHDISAEALNMLRRDYNLTFGFGFSGAQFPSGLCLQFSLGYSNITIKDGDYLFKMDNNYSYYYYDVTEALALYQADLNKDKEKFIEDFQINGVTLGFEPTMRKPLSKNLFFTVGFKTKIPLRMYTNYSNSKFENVDEDLLRGAKLNLTTFKMGLSLAI